MTDSIVSKLTVLLAEPIDSECKVVYLLAEVRKLLERTSFDPELGALKMYCHWALHVDLTQAGTVQRFLERIDNWVVDTVAFRPALNRTAHNGADSILEVHSLLEEFIYFQSFRNQLRQFLKYYGLPATLCDDETWWNQLVREYAGVIEDGSLIIRGNSPLSAIERVTFKKGAPLTASHHVPFVIHWTIRLKDGRTLRTSSETVPGGEGRMVLQSLDLIEADIVR